MTDINVPARFSGEFTRGEWLDGAVASSVGARFRGSNQHPALGTWQTVCTIIECEPRRALAYATGDPDRPIATWRFRLEELEKGHGTVRLVQSAQIGPGRSGLTVAIEARPDKERQIVAHRLEQPRANMEATVSGIKGLAEAVGNGSHIP